MSKTSKTLFLLAAVVFLAGGALHALPNMGNDAEKIVNSLIWPALGAIICLIFTRKTV